jgi:hypothetical protein
VTHRNETFLVVNSPSPPPVQRALPVVWQPTATRSISVQPVATRRDDVDLYQGHRRGHDASSDSGLNDLGRKFGPLPPQIAKILTASEDADNMDVELANKKKST